jgi:hypothetical protein
VKSKTHKRKVHLLFAESWILRNRGSRIMKSILKASLAGEGRRVLKSRTTMFAMAHAQWAVIWTLQRRG